MGEVGYKNTDNHHNEYYFYCGSDFIIHFN